MTSLVSLCIIRIEMDDDAAEGSRKATGDVRPSQTITVETYVNKMSAEPPPSLLPPGSEESQHTVRGGSEGPRTTHHGGSDGPQSGHRAGSEGPQSLQRGEGSTDEHRSLQELDFSFGNPLVEVTRGILHLYKENEIMDASQGAPSHTLCLLAVPATVSCLDLLAFTAACKSDIQHMRILRDDSPDRYMALLTFRSRSAAYEFRETFGGTAYSSLEPGAVCHAAWVRQVECTRGDTPPPPAATELPNCPVCLERMDESVEGLLTVQCAHSFHAGCLGAWRDGTCPVCRCAQSPDPPAASECAQCSQDGVDEAVKGGELWICLICGHIGCGRYEKGHAVQHYLDSNHTYTMQLGTNRVWDYAGENYVHRLLQNKPDGKLVATGAPEGCAPAAQEKVDSIQLECAHLLAAQLDTQRRHYEDLLEREKARAQAESQDLKTKLVQSEKNLTKLNKKMTSLNTKVSGLMAQLAEEKAMAEAAVRARTELAARASGGEAELEELRSQVRDLSFYVEVAGTIASRTDCEELRGGQVGLSSPQTKPRRKKHK